MSDEKQFFSFTMTLIRHGETNENKKGIIQGQLDTKLNELGRLQAQQLGKVYPISKCDLIYSSDLSRAYDTCRILMDEQKSVQTILTDERLRERSFGTLQGKTMLELKKIALESGKTIVDYTPPGGEYPSDVRSRVIDFIVNRLLGEVKQLGKPEGTKVLLVAHGGVIREMISYFSNFGHASLNVPKARLIPPNTSINDFLIKFLVTPQLFVQSIECLKMHDIGHLNEEVQKQALNQPQVNEGVSI